ncbi:MAG: class I SAM-dependent methyltransferase [Chitinophagaceae bacterium]|nr:MAG: class I SAM-dependent methyltransferase [Chitinophagaceae bacterium]
MIIRIARRILMRPFKNRYTFFTREHISNALAAQPDNRYESLLQNVNLKRCYYDEMYDKDGSHYLKVGLSAISCIEEALQHAEVKEIKQVLDLPCGYGRVMRFMKAYFPDAGFTACDLNKHAVDFCAAEFGATPVYSHVNLDDFTIPQKFDLIWCGSLITHLDAAHTRQVLRFFYRHLNKGGLLLFSMHGKEVQQNLATRKYDYTLSNAAIEKILSETAATGYGYANYKHTDGYGISLTTEEWMRDALEAVGQWKNYRLMETAWDNHHDVYSLVKAGD